MDSSSCLIAILIHVISIRIMIAGLMIDHRHRRRANVCAQVFQIPQLPSSTTPRILDPSSTAQMIVSRSSRCVSNRNDTLAETNPRLPDRSVLAIRPSTSSKKKHPRLATDRQEALDILIYYVFFHVSY